MKKYRILIFLILVIISIPALLIAANKIQSSVYDKQYTDIDKGTTSATYQLHKINVPGREFQFHFSSERAVIPGEPVPEDIDSYLYFDTVNRNIILETQEYVTAEDSNALNDVLTHYVRIGLDGQVISDVKGFYIKAGDILRNTVLIKDQLKPFQKWSDKSQPIYMKHFSKEKFNAGCLNPFSGIGSPTGGHPCNFWDGHGYYDITFGAEQLKVKIPCERYGLLTSEDSGYSTGLRYYLLPDKLTGGIQVAFIVYAKNYEAHSLYIIRKK